MKKIIVAALSVVILFIAGCGSSETAGRTGRTSSLIAEKYAPQSTIAMISFSSFEKLFSLFEIDKNDVINQHLTMVDRNEIVSVLGFDPLSLSGYEKIGFDTNREFGLVLSSLHIEGEAIETSSGSFALLLPVTNKNDFIGFIRERSAVLPQMGLTYSEENDMLKIGIEGEDSVLMTIKSDGDYVAVNISMNRNENAAAFFASSEKLAATPFYKEVAGEINMGSDAVFYFDSKKFMDHNAKGLEHLSGSDDGTFDFLKNNRGSAIVADLSSPDLVVSSVGFVEKNNIMHRLNDAVDDKSVITGFEKKPALILALFFNARQYMDYILSTLPESCSANEFRRQLRSIKDTVGIDVEDEIIDQLAGSFNIGIFDAATINMMQYNLVVNFNINDREKFINTIDRFASFANMVKMSEQEISDLSGGRKVGDKTDAYSVNLGMMIAYLVIEDNKVTLSTNRNLASNILDGSRKKYIDSIEKELARNLKTHNNYIYIDFSEAYTAAKTVYSFVSAFIGGGSIFDANTDKLAANLKYLYAYSNFDGKMVKAEFIIKTGFKKPFFQSMKEEIGKLNL